MSVESHDNACELNSPGWPQFKDYRDPVTGTDLPAGPYPCHCPARERGRKDAERYLARLGR